MALIQKIAPTMRFMKMLATCQILLFSNTLKKVRHNLHRTDHIQDDKQRIAD